jgi:hypothetical protein
MPVHYKSKGKTKMNVVEKLMKHAKHHTKEHMKKMRESMRKGKSFEEAHKIAMKSVGK